MLLLANNVEQAYIDSEHRDGHGLGPSIGRVGFSDTDGLGPATVWDEDYFYTENISLITESWRELLHLKYSIVVCHDTNFKINVKTRKYAMISGWKLS